MKDKNMSSLGSYLRKILGNFHPTKISRLMGVYRLVGVQRLAAVSIAKCLLSLHFNHFFSLNQHRPHTEKAIAGARKKSEKGTEKAGRTGQGKLFVRGLVPEQPDFSGTNIRSVSANKGLWPTAVSACTGPSCCRGFQLPDLVPFFPRLV